ncbi:hypothetical protein ACQKEM_21000 [Pseudomonas sp. NPDC077382]
MNYETIQVPTGDYDRFVQAACAAAATEMEKLVQATISTLRGMDATGMFGDVAARHLWDEYCWQLQEGPYDHDDIGFGSTSRNFGDVLDAVIAGALDELPQHTLLFLSIYTRKDLDAENESDSIGGISRDDIASAVRERVSRAAARRNLDVIGPYRGDVIPMEISLDGLAGEALSEVGEQSDFLSEHVDQMLEGGASNISDISHALLERYVELIHEDEDGALLAALFDRFENDIRALVLGKDIRPAVEDAISQLEDES